MDFTLVLTGDEDVTLFWALIAAKKKFLQQLDDADKEMTTPLRHELENFEALILQAVQFMGQDIPESKSGQK
jgi:hypothetical protein